MARKVEVICICTEETRSGPRSTREVLLEGDLTPRRLAKAIKLAGKERASYRKIFGPGTISPRHIVKVVIDGDDGVEEYSLSARHDDNLTWTQIVEKIG
jgi:hypothetical protein